MESDLIVTVLSTTLIFNLLSLPVRNNSKINITMRNIPHTHQHKVELIHRPCFLKNSDTVQGI